jgi:hypothetical protein
VLCDAVRAAEQVHEFNDVGIPRPGQEDLCLDGCSDCLCWLGDIDRRGAAGPLFAARRCNRENIELEMSKSGPVLHICYALLWMCSAARTNIVLRIVMSTITVL